MHRIATHNQGSTYDNLKDNVRAANIDLLKQALNNVDWASIIETVDTNLNGPG